MKINGEAKKRQEPAPLSKDPRVAVLEASLEANSLVPAISTFPQISKSKKGNFKNLLFWNLNFTLAENHFKNGPVKFVNIIEIKDTQNGLLFKV